MAVERKPGKNNKFGGVIAGAQHRGAAEQIALKAAHQKAVEQPRHQRVLQVQVHPIGIHLLRIAEHHGLQLRFLAPYLSLVSCRLVLRASRKRLLLKLSHLRERLRYPSRVLTCFSRSALRSRLPSSSSSRSARVRRKASS